MLLNRKIGDKYFIKLWYIDTYMISISVTNYGNFQKKCTKLNFEN